MRRNRREDDQPIVARLDRYPVLADQSVEYKIAAREASGLSAKIIDRAHHAVPLLWLFRGHRIDVAAEPPPIPVRGEFQLQLVGAKARMASAARDLLKRFERLCPKALFLRFPGAAETQRCAQSVITLCARFVIDPCGFEFSVIVHGKGEQLARGPRPKETVNDMMA